MEAASTFKKVLIHTDGGCEGNPGPGGWAAVLRHGEHERELAGGEPITTNNRMELQAAIAALEILLSPCAVTLYTDSQYLRQGITKWLRGWKAKGWRTSTRQPVKNEDLWRRLDAVTTGHRIEWKWLKGHAGHADNERCDQLAAAEIARIRKQFPREELKRLQTAFRSASPRNSSAPGLL